MEWMAICGCIHVLISDQSSIMVNEFITTGIILVILLYEWYDRSMRMIFIYGPDTQLDSGNELGTYSDDDCEDSPDTATDGADDDPSDTQLDKGNELGMYSDDDIDGDAADANVTIGTTFGACPCWSILSRCNNERAAA